MPPQVCNRCLQKKYQQRQPLVKIPLSLQPVSDNDLNYNVSPFITGALSYNSNIKGGLAAFSIDLAHVFSAYYFKHICLVLILCSRFPLIFSCLLTIKHSLNNSLSAKVGSFLQFLRTCLYVFL